MYFNQVGRSIDSRKDEPIRARAVGGTVCRYWLEKRCKKGEACEYLHEYVIEKLPECPNGHLCRIKDCAYKHTPKVIKECPFYMNGYCKDGKNIWIIS
jgi:cleavage and polyadenylation specificity factor subunit 4